MLVNLVGMDWSLNSGFEESGKLLIGILVKLLRTLIVARVAWCWRGADMTNIS